MSLETKHAQLCERLTVAEQQYYAGTPAISDSEYDSLYRELREIEAARPSLVTPVSPTQRVGTGRLGGFETVKHHAPMMSLENCYSADEMEEFANTAANLLELPPHNCCWCVEPKIDGLSLSLTYEKGVLVRALTRGNGSEGEDVTANARTIRTIPLKFNGTHPGTVVVRGEVYMPVTTFNRLVAAQTAAGDKPFANPRNAAVGALKLRVPAEVAKRGLAFLAYSVEEVGSVPGSVLPTQQSIMQTLGRLGFQVPHFYITDTPSLRSTVNTMEDCRRNFDFWTDGIVVKLDHVTKRGVLGANSKCPRWAIAAKFQSKTATTRLLAVTVQVGKTGALAPVAELEPVQLNGTTIARASLHNFDEIRRLGLTVGDLVEIEKAGEIIPQVLRVVSAAGDPHPSGINVPDRAPVPIPTKCPACDTPVKKDQVAIYCPNEQECPPQIKGRLEHWCSKGAMDIDGGGEVMIEKLFNAGIEDVASLYRMDMGLLVANKISERLAEKLLEAIEASKKQGLMRVLYGLSIPHVGEGTAKRLANRFRDIRAIMAANVTDLMQVQDIGETTAQALVQWFQRFDSKALIGMLEASGVVMKDEAKAEVRGKLSGKTCVVTGTLEMGTRDAMHALIEKNGGTVGGSVSKKTSYLVVGADAGSKVDKAKALNVICLFEQDFLKLLNERSP